MSATGLIGDNERPRAVLSGMLLVREEFRRQGVAQRLLLEAEAQARWWGSGEMLSLIHISEPTRLGMISYAVFCLKKKKERSVTSDQQCSFEAIL